MNRRLCSLLVSLFAVFSGRRGRRAVDARQLKLAFTYTSAIQSRGDTARRQRADGNYPSSWRSCKPVPGAWALKPLHPNSARESFSFCVTPVFMAGVNQTLPLILVGRWLALEGGGWTNDLLLRSRERVGCGRSRREHGVRPPAHGLPSAEPLDDDLGDAAAAQRPDIETHQTPREFSSGAVIYWNDSRS